jgi:hypothetical protein
MTNVDCTILDCPQCQSKRAGIIRTDPPRAKCADCGHIYNIATLPASDDPPKTQKIRRATPGIRHRRDNGPAELDVKPVPPPTPAQLGTLHLHTEAIIRDGPQQLLQAHHRASKLADRFGEEFKEQWRLKTKWLDQLAASHRARERDQARYAMLWRPMFLAVVALSHSVMLGSRAAEVSKQTVLNHREADPEFDAQVIEAQEHCIELLHSVTMRSAIEGDLEPIYWQGIEVGHIKKFDNRLRIEMLRAHMPHTFKQPGAKVAINTGATQNNTFICGPAEIEKLVALRQEALRRIQAKKANVTALPAEIVS